MKNNKGFSLVELLVALAVAAIVSGSIGYFLYHSMRMYADETVDISLQQELQTSVNTVMDAVMESQCLILDNSGEDGTGKGKTNAIVLGKFTTVSSGSLNSYEFTGSVFASSGSVASDSAKPSDVSGIADGKLYMMPCKDLLCSGTDIYEAIKDATTSSGATDDYDLVRDNKYLMSECVQNFHVSITRACSVSGNAVPTVPVAAELENAKSKYSFWQEKRSQEDGTEKTVGVYYNNITLNVGMSFAAMRGSGIEYKTVNDMALMRNHLSEDIFLIINASKYQFIEYDEEKRRSGNDLEVETVNVENEIALGPINVTETYTHQGYDENEVKNILEIVSDPKYSMMDYLIGGCEPIDKYGLDGAANSELGIQDSVREGIALNMSQLIGDNGSLSNFRWNKTGQSGYFEKIDISDRVDKDGNELGGVYSIRLDKDKKNPMITGTYIPVDYTDMVAYPNRTYYIKLIDNWNADNDPVGIDGYRFDLVNGERPQYFDIVSDAIVGREVNGKTEYEVNSKYTEITPTHPVATQFYRFKWGVSCNSDKYGGVYFLSEYSFVQTIHYKENHEFDWDNWQTDASRELAKNYNVIKEDFCWIWHGVTDETSEYYSTDFYLIKDKGTSKDKIFDVSPSDFDKLGVGSKIYVNNYQKYNIKNNEMFILYCMNKHAGSESSTQALYDSNLVIDTDNLGVLNGFYGDGLYDDYLDDTVDRLNKITHTAMTPGAVTLDDVARADLVVITRRDGGIYNHARKLYGVEHAMGGFNSSENEYFPNDISSDVLLEIYKKVINNTLAIACSTNYNKFTPGSSLNDSSNLDKLFFMLYKFENPNIVCKDGQYYCTKDNANPYIKANSEDDIIKHVVDTADELPEGGSYKFSGRILFTDFIQSYWNFKMAYSMLNNRGKVVKDDANKYYKPINFVKFEVIDEHNCKVTVSYGPDNKIKVNGTEKSGSSRVYSGRFKPAFGEGTLRFPFKNNDSTEIDGNCDLFFLYNEYYGIRGFRYVDSPQIGLYGNQLLFDDNSEFLTYDKPTGLHGIQDILNNTDLTQTINETYEVSVGDIEFTGAGIKNEGSDATKYDDNTYSIPMYTYMDGADEEKVIYLNEFEFEKAKENGLQVYAVIAMSKEYNTFNAEKKFDGTSVVNNFKYKNKLKATESTLNTSYEVPAEENPNILKYYGEFVLKNKEYDADIDSADKEYVTRDVAEIMYHIPNTFFQTFDSKNDPTKTGEYYNRLNAHVEINGAGTPSGYDEVTIIVRDTFDLD